MKGEQMGWHSPPKAEARGSNPFGCAISLNMTPGNGGAAAPIAGFAPVIWWI